MRMLQDGRHPIESSRTKDDGDQVTFSTAGISAPHQFDAYQAYCAPVIDIAPTENTQAGFRAICDMWMLGGLVLRRIRVPAGNFARSAVQVRRDSLDYWVFNVARSGTQLAQTATDHLASEPGIPSIFSFAGVYQAQRTDLDWLGLFIPRGTNPGLDAGFRHDRHTALNNPGGRLLASHLRALADELPCMTKDDVARVGKATQAMVTACITSTTVSADDTGSCSVLPRILRASSFIDHHLGSAILGPEVICKAAGISRSNPYRMFEPHGGVVRYIQRGRLRRAHDLLADPHCTRTIGSIAADFCFSDLASFGRAFWREFSGVAVGLCVRDRLRVLAQ